MHGFVNPCVPQCVHGCVGVQVYGSVACVCMDMQCMCVAYVVCMDV